MPKKSNVAADADTTENETKSSESEIKPVENETADNVDQPSPAMVELEATNKKLSEEVAGLKEQLEEKGEQLETVNSMREHQDQVIKNLRAEQKADRENFDQAKDAFQKDIVSVKSDLEIAEKIAREFSEQLEGLEPVPGSMLDRLLNPTETQRVLEAGTILKLADVPVTLPFKTIVEFDGAQNEQLFVGLAVLTGNFERNREQLKFRYDNLGTRLPVNEQVDSPSDLPAFLLTLDEEEARSFGVHEAWQEYQANEKAKAAQ